MKNLACCIFTAGMLGALHGESTVNTTARFVHSANAGWIDARPSASEGIRVTDTFLAGNAYAANFGWLSLGNGAPLSGHSYSNASATDSGVNLSLAGELTGFAYAGNIGWISFEQTHGKPKIDLLTGRFSGSAYSANIGWIPLENMFSDLIADSISRTDSDGDGIPDGWELFHFGNLATAAATTDRDGDGASDLNEYLAGTRALDAGSSLRIVSQTFSADYSETAITFTMVPTRRYRIEHNTALNGPWTDSALGVFTPLPAPTARGSLTGLGSVPRRFFRIVAVNPL